MNEKCICLERIGDNGTCPVHGSGYTSGAASLFASAAREPIYEGQPCYFCNKQEGQMIFDGYDEVLGALWIHQECKQEMEGAIQRATSMEAYGE